MNVSMDVAMEAFCEAISAGAQALAEKDGSVALLQGLLEAALSGDYTDVATDLAQQFWELQSLAGAGTATHAYRRFFAELVTNCPALREPLQKALDEYSPFTDLLPPAAGCGSCTPCGEGSCDAPADPR